MPVAGLLELQQSLPARPSAPRPPSAVELLEDGDQRAVSDAPSRGAIAAAVGGLPDHPVDARAMGVDAPPRRVGLAAIAGTIIVNGALLLLVRAAPAEAPAPQPKTIRLVFLAPPPPPPPPPKGDGGTALHAPGRKQAATTPQIPAEKTKPARVDRSMRREAPRVAHAAPAQPAPSAPPAHAGAAGVPDGVEGGVEGGVVGGMLGGVLGGSVAGDADGAVPMDLQSLKLVRSVTPAYPPLAKKGGVAGLVVLEVIVDASGQVADVRVLRSIPVLDPAAVAAVRQWAFEPPRRDGVPTRARVTVELQFNLVA